MIAGHRVSEGRNRGSRLRRRLLGAIATALLAGSVLLVLETPTSALCIGPTISISDDTARRGGLIEIRGTGWGTDCHDTGAPPPGEGPLGDPITAVGFELVQGDRRWELGYHGVKPDYTFTRTVQIPRDAKTGAVKIVAASSVPEISVDVPLMIDPGPAFPTLPKQRYRMTPSDRTVSPGQIISIEVRGPDVNWWGGGVDSYVERRNRDGEWERVFMLHWYGPGRTPTVRDPGSVIEFLGVQASPFDVVIPPVAAGEYRITRRFLVAPGYSLKMRVLATRITVEPCADGKRATFVTTPAPTGELGLGRPACAPSNS